MPEFIFSQTDYEFWFAAPEITYEITAPPALVRDSLDRPVVLAFTTYDGPAHIVISQPANPAFIPINCTVLTDQFFQFDLTAYIEQIECKPINAVLNKGLLITSDKPINAIYEVQTYINSETFALKGRNALGKEFIIPSQNICFNYPYTNPPARNRFTVLATQDQTQVKIVPKKLLEGFSTLDTITILLNRGQTWSGQAVSGDTSAHIGGSFVLSDKPITVTMVDDALRPYTAVAGSSVDLAGDQLIPKKMCGNEYILAYNSYPNHYNHTIIYAFENSTLIYNEGVLICNLNKAESYHYQPVYYDHTDYITSNKPILVYLFSQYNLWASDESGQVYPPITCGGSKKVTMAYTGPFTNLHNIDFLILTQNGNQLNFTCSHPNYNAYLQDPNVWAPVPGTANQYMYTMFGGGIMPGTSVTFYNSTGTFQLTKWNELEKTVKNCVVTEFGSLNLGVNTTLCNGDTILLDAGFGRDSYLWNTGATTQTINVTSSGTYWVTVSQNTCTLSDTIVVSASNPAHTSLPQTATACPGDSALLDAGTGRSWYQWNTGATTQTIYASLPGNYWVTVPVFDCSNTFTDTVSVYIPDSVILGADRSFCIGDSVLLDAGSGRHSYLWSTGDTSRSIWAKIAGTYWVRATYKFCVLLDTVVLTTTGDSVDVSIVASINNICAGTPVTFTATPSGSGTLTYDWKVNGTSMGVNNSMFNFTPANGEVVTCVLSSSITTCVTNNPATSNAITMVVTPVTSLAVNISASQNPACLGNPITFTALPSVSGPTNAFTWKVNGVTVGTNQTTYTYNPVNGDVVTCELASSEQCVTGGPVTSNSITMSVAPSLAVDVSISSSLNNICAGTSVTFTATPTNPGATPVYLWKVNDTPQGSNNNTFLYVPVNGDIITCTLNSSITSCLSNNPATSNQIFMQVNPIVPVSISVTPSQNNICEGTQVTFTATPAGQGTTPFYLWKVNGLAVGGNQLTYSYIPANTDIITCALTSSEECPAQSVVTSAPVQMIVNPNLTVSVNINASNNPVCAGIPVTFTATPVNGGLTPSYQWKVNGGNVGTNLNNYTYLPVNGDVITCSLTTSIASCATPITATANSITMVISALPVVTYTICTDSITTTNARPIKLKGGIPLGGTYSGPGVNSFTGVFSPSIAGAGTKAITYTYTNAGMCTVNKTKNIIVQAPPAFTCGNPFVDIRDNHVYQTIQIGTQCWFAEDLDYGLEVPEEIHQQDNCINEKYTRHPSPVTHHSVYQWDELMQYSIIAGEQGLCPPSWHIPTETEWQVLFNSYSGIAFSGSPLKYTGFSRFDIFMNGIVPQNENWEYQSFGTFYWTSTSYGPFKALAHGFNEPDPSASTYPSFRSNAFNVRCIKD